MDFLITRPSPGLSYGTGVFRLGREPGGVWSYARVEYSRKGRTCGSNQEAQLIQESDCSFGCVSIQPDA